MNACVRRSDAPSVPSRGAGVSLALLGAGLFARDAYLPLLRQAAPRVRLVAVWSRSEAAAAAALPAARDFAPAARAEHGEAGLAALLGDPGVDAVAVVLPVQVMLEVVERALRAGKHVLQEKPLAPSAAAAAAALRLWRGLPQPPVWALAENYRSEQVFQEACRQLPRLGRIIKADLVCDMPMTTANKYYNSAWRRDAAGCPGGFTFESSVHFLAALRLLARAAGLGEVVAAAGQASSAAPGALPAPDTLLGLLRLAGGAPASVSISFACANVRFSLALVGTRGSLEVQRGGWGASRGEYLLTWQAAGESAPATKKLPFTGLEGELAAFADLVEAHRAGGSQPGAAGSAAGAAPDVGSAAFRVAPEEGARDVAVIEALLQSAQQGGAFVKVQVID